MGENNSLPPFLSHYYEESSGPFRSLSDLPIDQAEAIQEELRRDGNRFASRRTTDYLCVRRELESKIRALYIARGGKPLRSTPHYLILGECAWLKEWYVKGCEIRIPLTSFSPQCVSFTYGDSFPAMRFQDGKPYRGKVFTLAELPGIVAQFGLPQIWNATGSLAPERYIEAQVWEDGPIENFLR